MSTYQNSLSDEAEMLDSFLQAAKGFLQPTDVDLTVDAVDLGIEAEQDAECGRKVAGQRRLSHGLDPLVAALDDKLDGNNGLMTNKEQKNNTFSL